MDVNERIVETWLRSEKKMFTQTEIYYGNFHRDIDILAVNPNTHEIWDCEVKVRTGSTQISNNNSKQNGFEHFVTSMKNPNRDKVIKKLFKSKDFKMSKKFITTKSLFGKSEKNQQKWIKQFNNENIDIIFFDEIIKDLYRHAQESNKSTNEIVQVLRLFNIYEDKSVA